LSDELSDALFGRFAKFLFQKTGISLKDYKKYLVINRLSSLVGPDKSYPTFEDFYDALTSDLDGRLTQDFINVLTTNFSYFFRDPIHFSVMEQYLQALGSQQDYLRFWSAASSTGEEAYSMAIVLTKCSASLPANRRILASDISTKVLTLAERGVYNAEGVEKYVTPEDRLRFFSHPEPSKYAVKPDLKVGVDFRQFNLLSTFPFQKKMDIVFLRNVLIYMGPEERLDVVERIYAQLKPGGLLLIGLSESLAGLRHRFKMHRGSVFQKTSR